MQLPFDDIDHFRCCTIGTNTALLFDRNHGDVKIYSISNLKIDKLFEGMRINNCLYGDRWDYFSSTGPIFGGTDDSSTTSSVLFLNNITHCKKGWIYSITGRCVISSHSAILFDAGKGDLIESSEVYLGNTSQLSILLDEKLILTSRDIIDFRCCKVIPHSRDSDFLSTVFTISGCRLFYANQEGYADKELDFEQTRMYGGSSWLVKPAEGYDIMNMYSWHQTSHLMIIHTYRMRGNPRSCLNQLYLVNSRTLAYTKLSGGPGLYYFPTFVDGIPTLCNLTEYGELEIVM